MVHCCHLLYLAGAGKAGAVVLAVDPVFAVAELWYHSGFGWFLPEKHRGFPVLQYVAEDLVFLYSSFTIMQNRLFIMIDYHSS